jgi:hypothetical protein
MPFCDVALTSGACEKQIWDQGLCCLWYSLDSSVVPGPLYFVYRFLRMQFTAMLYKSLTISRNKMADMFVCRLTD